MDQTNLASQPGAASTATSEEPVEHRLKPQLGFVQRRLPWLIAAGALLVYGLTLPRWITFLGLGPLARAAGWDWHPALHAPLQFLLTYPIRWLPAGWQVAGLNLFAAVCGTLTLALLARSVALLPHDRTRDQRQTEQSDHALLSIRTAWLPPLLAALVCGLQMTFWENAVVWTGEALDLLLFAYVIRCLLEFRIDSRDSWLTRLALVYGLAMTNNFSMIAFLPALGIALIWIKGLSVFTFRFCSRMALCVLAGLSLYLLLPILHGSSGWLETGFGQLLRLNLGFQKNAIFGFRRVVVLMLSFTSLMPVLFMGIKWPATFGDISAAGNALTNLMTHVIHGVFLLACLYVAFDPGYSPRKLGYPYPFLPFYYLGALSIGYFSAYFLLVFGNFRLKVWQRPSVLRKGLNWAVLSLVWAAAVAVPVGLAYQNLPQLRANQGRDLLQYANLTASSLPAQETVVLSDEPLLLYALSATLQQSGSRGNKILVETAALPSSIYHRYLARRYPGRWPQPSQSWKATEPADAAALGQVLAKFEQSVGVHYLQPSFGYHFERMYLQPRNLVYQLKSYEPNTLASPPLAEAELNANIQFWQRMKTQDLKPLLQSLKPVKGKRPENYNALVGNYYSRAVNYLGVELQKNGDLQRAGELFGLALEFNADNPSALINQEYNRKLPAHPEVLKRSEEVEKLLGRYFGSWDLLLGRNGPVDEPAMRNDLAQILVQGRNYRQAAQQLLRVSTLTPTNLDARIGVADMCNRAGLPDLALAYAAEARASQKRLHTADREALIQIEGWAHAYRNDLPAAERILREAQAKNPLDEAPYSTLAEIYLRLKRIPDAMGVLEQQLKTQPENSGALNNYARMKILNNEFGVAVKLLDHALSLDPKNSLILLNRAICNLKSGHIDDAQRDYQSLETTLPKVPYVVYYGLFEVAFQKKTPKAALKYGQLYLKTAPAGSPESKNVQERIKKVKTGSF